MKLYDFPGAPNPRRVRIFLAEKKLELPTEVVDVPGGANRTPAFLAKNPLGLLPVFQLDDGSFLSESMAICRYLDALHPEPPLFGTSPQEAAVVEMWSRRAEWEVFRHVGEFFRHTAPFFADRYVQRPEVAEDARNLVLDRLGVFDAALADRRFLTGDRFSVADITAWVSVDLGIPSAFSLGGETPHLQRWFEEVSARPSIEA